ncbi:type II toxin-antitoxin system mRNA interferase toxin, RelE/StbE family [Desulfobulbus alkaliphilus]|uniref:type II toxin-antitoxin system mRNA interferase toxin, RelE/StbE family n=1 Tax=Desulfobulbus alkaliphilus TaxID=869814 RepID=UPI001963B2EF|nr:type II toxin-antitoxin system RelE/ParE family toxin [Desulfobulbus alkaliphilus]
MSYSLKIKRSALKKIQALPNSERLRIVEAIDRLSENPHVGKLLKGDLSGLRRIRTGDYRIVYEIDEGQVVVLVLRVAHRKNVYR